MLVSVSTPSPASALRLELIQSYRRHRFARHREHQPVVRHAAHWTRWSRSAFRLRCIHVAER